MAKFFIDHHGCAKNQTDGELIAGFLLDSGYEYTSNPQEADYIIINSCGFIESAKKESLDAVYSIRKQFPNKKLILTGCLAERYPKVLEESMPELDGIFGNGDLSKFPEYLKACSKSKTLKAAVYEQKGICEGKRPYLFNFSGSAYVKITEGCSNNCSFCAIPLIRGPVRSRPVNNIIKEIKGLVQKGVSEINLIGQDLAAFTLDKKSAADWDQKHSPLAYLLSKISLVEGDFIIRCLYIHPDHFNTDILDVYKKDKRFVPYFDIPFQNGDDTIIKAMNRVGPVKKYVQLIKTIRKELPDAVIRTTFMTGFPGETEESFNNTKAFINAIEPDWSGCFAFSREDDTPAYSFKNRVPAKIAKERASCLEQLQSQITAERMKKYISKKFEVLVEEIISSAADDGEGLALARAWFQAPDVDGCIVVRYDSNDNLQNQQVKPGNLLEVVCLAATGVDLDCRFVKLVKASKKSSLEFIEKS